MTTEGVICGSGLCWLSGDEMQLVAGIRAVKQQGSGEMYTKVQDGRYVTWNCKPDFGNPQILNIGLGIMEASVRLAIRTKD